MIDDGRLDSTERIRRHVCYDIVRREDLTYVSEYDRLIVKEPLQ